MTRIRWVAPLAFLAALMSLSAAAAYEAVPAPEKGKPWPGNQQCLPYEDVLDTADLVLAGTVKSFEGGKVKLAGVKALRGNYDKAEAEVACPAQFGEDAIEKDKPAVFLCLVGADGALRLAGEAPKGGGMIVPGAELAARLLEAARDPEKAYASADPAVKLSAAYRLSRAWVAAPESKKPKPPPDLVETLLDGLTADKLRDRNVNAAARNAINLLMNCDISKEFGYSVNAPDWKRDDKASDAKSAWQHAVKSIEAGRKARAEGKAFEPPKNEFDLQRAALFVPETPAGK